MYRLIDYYLFILMYAIFITVIDPPEFYLAVLLFMRRFGRQNRNLICKDQVVFQQIVAD